MAARETGFGQVEQYMHAGKLLALELLVRVFENPHHHWSTLRPEVTKLSVFASPYVTSLMPGLSAWPTFLDLLLPDVSCVIKVDAAARLAGLKASKNGSSAMA